MTKFTSPTKAKDIKRKWHLVDAKEGILGRLASKAAPLLMGKSKPYFVTNLDCGDYVVIVNAAKVKLTGRKESQKTYMRYSGYPGGLKIKTFAQVKKENPERIIREAVSGMLPKNKLRALMLKRLYIYGNEEHPYKDKFGK